MYIHILIKRHIEREESERSKYTDRVQNRMLLFCAMLRYRGYTVVQDRHRQDASIYKRAHTLDNNELA
jgi:hypothetical protein